MKPKRKLINQLWFILLTAMIFIFSDTIVLITTGYVPMRLIIEKYRELLPNGFAENFISYFSFILIHVVTIIYILLTRKEVFRRFTHGYEGNTYKLLIIGTAAGIICNAVCIGAAAWHGDLSFKISGMKLWTVFVLFFAVFVQSSAEELVCRGYMYHYISDSYGPATAIIANSCFFGLMHILNPGISVIAIINIIAVGALLSIAVYRLKSHWFAVAFHTGWNFCQAFIFGLPNSGEPATYSILAVSSERKSALYDTIFGVEGTITATVVLIAAAVIIYFCKKSAQQSNNGLT